jgi:hypothetical protein
MDLVEVERFFVKFGLLSYALEFPGRNIRIVRIVPKSLAVWCLTLLAEVASARLSAVSGVERQQLREFEIVGNASRVFEALVQVVWRSRHGNAMPEILAQFRDGFERVR